MSQEIPFPESDAREIANPSIDSGRKPGTRLDAAALIAGELRERAQTLIDELPARGRAAYESAEQKAKANPWITIAAASAGALAAGFLLGKLLSAKAAPTYTEEEYPAGYDE